MENCGVLCNVCDCMHHCAGNKCCLETIEVSNEKTSAQAVANPHFCKSYDKK